MNYVYYCSMNGEVRIYDTRKMSVTETVRAPAPLAAIDVHPLCNLIAWLVLFFKLQNITTFKFYNNFDT